MATIPRVLRIGPGKMKILVLNAGSSTYKLSCFAKDQADQLKVIWEGKLDWGTGVYQLFARNNLGFTVEQALESSNIAVALEKLLQTLWSGSIQVIGSKNEIEKIGHRIVHGGEIFFKPVIIDEEVKKEIKKLIPLAPLHNPVNLEGIHLMEQLFELVPQIAVFDTSFHLTMPEVVKTYPIPLEWKKKGIQRYGFHGISHQYCAEQVQAKFLEGRSVFKMINCHLGNGASLCAIQDGKSVDTTMGMTPMEGLMMGTRSGSIDPGIPLYLMREEQYSYAEVDRLLNFDSGLKGICGSSDMREIKSKRNEPSKLAIEMFVYRLKFFIGALIGTLNGIDLLTFTGGIGENDADIRSAVCAGLSFLDLGLDEKKNRQCTGDEIISSLKSKVRVGVIHTQEEWMIARACIS